MATNYTYKDYIESEKVRKAQQALEKHNSTKPGEYSSQWAGKMNDTLNRIENRGPFSYDLASDALFQQYKDRYSQLGKMAMQDTAGQAAALTGGYGNSYAVTAGNQAYQNYLMGINDVVPELQQMAYERYNQEGQNLLNLYGLYSDRENNDYSRYQDVLTNWNNERAYLADFYNNERTYDRSIYDSDRNFDYGKWTDNRNYDYQVARDKVADEQWAKEFAESQRQYNNSLALQKAQLAASKANSSSKPARLTNAEYNSLQTELQSYKNNKDNAAIENRINYLKNSGYLSADEAADLYDAYVTDNKGGNAANKTAAYVKRVTGLSMY